MEFTQPLTAVSFQFFDEGGGDNEFTVGIGHAPDCSAVDAFGINFAEASPNFVACNSAGNFTYGFVNESPFQFLTITGQIFFVPDEIFAIDTVAQQNVETPAPEIDPGSAAAPVALTLGLLAVVLDRRRKESAQ